MLCVAAVNSKIHPVHHFNSYIVKADNKVYFAKAVENYSLYGNLDVLNLVSLDGEEELPSAKDIQSELVTVKMDRLLS